MTQLTAEEVRRIIFVKVDNTLHSPDHPSIIAAADVIMQRVEEMVADVRADEAEDRHAAYLARD